MVYILTFGDIWGILMVNVTIYSIHGSYGISGISINITVVISAQKTRAKVATG